MISLALLSLSMALTVMGDSWGPAYSLGPTNSAIIEATTTFNPGTPPSNPQKYLFLWPGISNSTSGLIQSGADSTADQSGYCGASSDQWCVMASYFGVVDGATTQLNGDMVPVDANTDITINYKLGDDQVTWTQTVTVNGEVISTLESYDGPLYNGGWGTGTECQSDCTGSTSPQYYTDTTIILMEADADFSSTLGMGSGVEASDMVTTDNGKTWTIASITIPAMIDDGSASSSSTAAAFAASSGVTSSSVSGSTSTPSGSYTYTSESTGETESASIPSQGSTATFSGSGPESSSSSGGFPGSSGDSNSTQSGGHGFGGGHGGPQGSGNGTFGGEGGPGSNSTTSGGLGEGNSTSLPSQGSPSASLSTAAAFPESSAYVAASNGSTSGSDPSEGSYSSDLTGETISIVTASNSFPSATFSGESPSATSTSSGTSGGSNSSSGSPFGGQGSSNSSSPFGEGSSNSSSPFSGNGSTNSSSPFGGEGSSNSSSPFGGQGSEPSSGSFGGQGSGSSDGGQEGSWSSAGGAFPSGSGTFGGGEGGGFGVDGSNSASGFGATPTAVASVTEGSFTGTPISALGASVPTASDVSVSASADGAYATVGIRGRTYLRKA